LKIMQMIIDTANKF